MSAIGKAEDGAANQKSNLTGCDQNAMQCIHCGTGEMPNGIQATCRNMDDMTDDNESTTLSRVNSSASSLIAGIPDLSSSENVQDDILTCLPRSASELDDLQKRVKDGRKSNRESQAQLADAQAELAKMQTDAVAEQNKLRDQGDNIQEKVKARITDIKRALTDAQNKISEQLDSLQSNFDDAEAAARQVLRKRDEAQVAYDDAVRTLEAQCHASALKQVEDLRQAELAAIRNSTFSKADFWGAVGATSKQKYQDKARGFYNDCIKDSTFAAATKSAAARRDLAQGSADDELTTIRNKEQMIEQKANQLKVQALPQAQQQALEDMQTESDLMTKSLNRLDRDMQLAQQAESQKEMAKRQSIDRLSLNAMEDRQDYDEDVAKMSALRRYTHSGKGPKEGTVDAAIDTMGDVEVKAAEVADACSCDGPGAPPICNTVCGYLSSHGLPKAHCPDGGNSSGGGTSGTTN